MKDFLIIWILVPLTCFTANSQEGYGMFHSEFEQAAFSAADPFKILVASDPDTDHSQYKDYLNDFQKLAKKLQRKSKRWSELKLLEKTFFYTHRKKLDWYSNYVTLPDVLNTGQYDCLTGTAFYALLLDELDITYTIYEFDFHVFLVAHTHDSDSVLFESTDPFYGFIRNSDEVAEYINSFINSENASYDDNRAPIGSNNTDQYSSRIFNRISLKELVGLQYFNLAIDAYNYGHLNEAQSMLKKANLLYPSRRIKEMKKVFDAVVSVRFAKN